MGALAFLTGPIGRWLLIAALLGLVYVKGRIDQHRADDQAQAAHVAAVAAEEARNLQSAAALSARVSQAHGAAVQAVQADNDALKRQIAAARIAVRLVPAPATPSTSPAGESHAAQACPDIDADRLQFGPDFVSLWNRAYGGAEPVVPGAGRPPGAVPESRPPETRPEWQRRAAGDPVEARR